MGYLYVDDSVHSRGGFALAGVVYSSESMTLPVARVLRSAGLTPGVDEFKSGDQMHGRPELQALRDTLRRLVEQRCQIGVVVVPASARTELDVVALRGVAHMLAANSLAGARHCIALDEDLGSSVQRARAFARSDPVLAGQDVRLGQDSKRVLGIQLADLVAHTCAIMLLDALGHVKKKVQVGEDVDGDPGRRWDLGFVLWAGLRYARFRRLPLAGAALNPLLDATPGLFIDARCDPELRAAAEHRFARVYMGCIS